MLGIGSSLGLGPAEASCTTTGFVAEYTAIYFADSDIGGDEDWYVRDSTAQHTYGIANISSESVVPYSCNTLLLLERPMPSEVKVCAAVFVKAEDFLGSSAEVKHRMLCEFWRRLIKDMTKKEISKENVDKIVEA
jgi:hypothetical protein